MQLKKLIVAAAATIALASTAAVAKTSVTVKWPTKVGKTIKLISVNVEPAMAGNYHMASFTYQALKNCSRLTVIGHTFTKDDIQEGPIALSTKMGVKAGQKFKDQTVITLDPGGYIIIENAYCN